MTWPLEHTLDAMLGKLLISNEEWRTLLGALTFRLPLYTDDDEKVRFRPSFRSLFSYFVRRQNSGGFTTPTQYSTKQQPWDQQVSISYLLGLDAGIPKEFQEVRVQEKAMSELPKAAKEGSLGRYFGLAAELRTRLTIAEARARRLREQFANFVVVPEYANFEREASTLTREISNLNDQNTSDRELILQLEDALANVQPPAAANLNRLYAEGWQRCRERSPAASRMLSDSTKPSSGTAVPISRRSSRRPMPGLLSGIARAKASICDAGRLWAF